MITSKPDPGPYSSSFIHGESWLDFNSMQTWNGVDLIYPMVTKDYQLEPVKPVLMAEGAYSPAQNTVLMSLRSGFAGKPTTPTWPGAITLTGTMTVGACCPHRSSYGCFRHHPVEHNEADLSEPKRMVESISGSKRVCRGGNAVGKILNLAARHKDAQWIVVYLGAKTSISIHMNKITAGKKVDAFWIDSRTGQAISVVVFQMRASNHSSRRTDGKTPY